jgi:hypothetical protein
MHNARVLWLAIIMIVAAVIGVAGGTLSWLGGASVPNAVLAGAGSFGATVLLLLAIMYFLDGTRPS